MLVLLLGSTILVVQAQEQQDVPGIELTTFTWNKSTLQALIVTQENQTWWKPHFIDITQRSIDQWNEALDFFADKYPDYSYVSFVNIILNTSNTTLPDYDIYIMFGENIAIQGRETLGLTTTVPYRNGTIQKAIIELSSKSGPIDLTKNDQRDVANHEFGHALGLGHSNSTEDLMYPYYDLISTDNAISTLDLYGLATTFSWIISQNNSKSVPRFTTLPQEIPYEYAPVTNPTPKGITDNPLVKAIVIFLALPYVAFVVLAMLFLLAVSIFLYWQKPKKRNLQK